ncbi:MAG: DUF3060 domain-containing protein [Myxococcaceae bacterium]|nr:DUF3060 domain-containing protein [Myxococcaceae bacterium]
MRFIAITCVVASAALAQVTVTGKDGKAVRVGAGTVEVKKGDKAVNVNTGSAGVQVQGTQADGTQSGVAVETNGEAAPAGGAAAGVGPASALVGSTWQVRGMGKTETHACAANEDVDVAGQSNTLTFTGPCRVVKVSGQSNTVTLDEVVDLRVSGMTNTATWKQGPGGKAPKVKVSGMGNAAPQAK